MTHLDLCTGIGGFHIAAEWAGFETVGFAEIDPYCCKLLAEKWPEIKNYGNVKTADFGELRNRICVLSGGVPCQPASLAGKRRGSSDDRWLWPAVLDVVGSVQPAWCIFENPDGILSLDEFGGILLRLESLGYQVRAFCLPANAVGAKHRRNRVFIVANAMCARGGTEWPKGNQDASIVANAGREAERERAGLCPSESEWKWWRRSDNEDSQTLADPKPWRSTSAPWNAKGCAEYE